MESKTTVLDSITYFFTTTHSSLQRRAISSQGHPLLAEARRKQARQVNRLQKVILF